MLRAFSVVSACLAFTACGYTPPPPGAPMTLSSRQVEMVQAGVSDTLRDPSSAQFGPLVASASSDRGVTVCGTVNAKNAFGGYAGRNNFIGILTPAGFELGTMAPRVDDWWVLRQCQEAGAAI